VCPGADGYTVYEVRNEGTGRALTWTSDVVADVFGAEIVEVDPAETRRMQVAVEILLARGLWEPFCRETGMNEWARNEGQVRDGEMLSLSEAQAVRIGLLPRR
jgi:hypothetical protein